MQFVSKKFFSLKNQKLSYDYLYGINPIMIALNNKNRQIHELMVSDHHKQNITQNKIINIIDKANESNIKVKFIPKEKIENFARNQPHQGIILKCNHLPFIRIEQPQDLYTANKKQGLIYVLLDQITDPQNFGALIRTIFFLGIDGIIVNEQNKCPLNSTVSKTSSGAMELIEINSVQKPQNFLKSCKSQNWRIIGTGLKLQKGIQNISLNDFKLDNKENLIVVFGSEGSGISPVVALECQESIYIQSGKILQFPETLVDSLNVSVSAGIILSKIKSMQM